MAINDKFGMAENVAPGRTTTSTGSTTTSRPNITRPPRPIPRSSFGGAAGRGRFVYSPRTRQVTSPGRILSARSLMAQRMRERQRAALAANRNQGMGPEEVRDKLGAPYNRDPMRGPFINTINYDLTYESDLRRPAPLSKELESKRADENQFIFKQSPTSGVTYPVYTGQADAVRRPLEARALKKQSDQALRDRAREDNQHWQNTIDMYKTRFPGQTEVIDQIARVEAMPETTLQERNAKIQAFLSIEAKGGLKPWVDKLRTGYWTRAEKRMAGVDTMLQRDRYAKSFAWLNDSTQFDLSDQDVADMISIGLLSWGKVDADGTKHLVTKGNRDAVERFFDDNFTTDENGKYVRVNENNLIISPEYALKAGVQLDSEGRVIRVNEDLNSADLVDAPLRNERLDYSAMANEYLQDQANYADLTGKIDQKIRDEGGGDLLDRIYSGKFDAKDVQNLRQYMYSFNSSYGPHQERWINEEILGITAADEADRTVARRAEESLGEFRAGLEERRQEERAAALELAQSTAEANFRYVDEATGQVVNILPVEQWPQALSALIDSGTAGVVPRDILNEIFLEDVLSGKRRELDADTKRMLYVSVLEAAQAGAPIDPFILTMVEGFGKDVPESAVREEMLEREGDGRSWFDKTRDKAFEFSYFGGMGEASLAPTAPFALWTRAAAGLGLTLRSDTDILSGFEQAFKMTPEELRKEFVEGRVAEMVSDPYGPLSPTNPDSGKAAAFVDNAIKSPIRAGLGMPMGMYYMVTDPIGTGTAILKDYEYRYGGLWGNEDSNFVRSALEDPWAPAMDILGLVPVLGFAAKGAQVGRIAATVKRVNANDYQQALADANTPARVNPFARDADIPEGELASWQRGELFRVDDDGNVSSKPFELDMGPVYDDTIRADGLRRLEELSSGKPVRFVSAVKFAQAQRAAINGDMNAFMRIVYNAPGGFAGLNSSYTPHLTDKVAAWFSPRWSPFSMADVVPEGTDDATMALREAIVRESVEKRGIGPEEIMEIEAGGGLMRRRAGSPIARGVQDMVFWMQKGIAKNNPTSPLVSMPLVGFNFRYVNALRAEPYGANDLLQRELFQHTKFASLMGVNMGDGAPKDYQFSDAEQLAVMNVASGGMYSPANLLAIALKNIERQRGEGVSEQNATLQLRLAEADLMQNPEFLRQYHDAFKAIMDIDKDGVPVNERARRMKSTSDYIIQQTIRNKHQAGVEMDGLSMRELTLRHQVFLNAARLTYRDMFEELQDVNGENLTGRIGVLSGAYHFLETGKFDDIPDENGVNLRAAMRELDDADEAVYKDIIDRVRRSVDYMARDKEFRNMDKVPFFVVDKVIDVGGRKFVVGRRLRVKGEFERSSQRTTREGLVDSEQLTLPIEAFLTKKASKKPKKSLNVGDGREIMVYSRTKNPRGVDKDMPELQEQLMRAALNTSMRLFPNARDFTDKAVFKTMLDDRETFEQKINDNVIADSGLMSFDLRIQFEAMRNAAYRRFNVDLQGTIEESAILVTRAQAQEFAGAYQALRTMRVHDTLEAAQRYIDGEKVGSSPGVEGKIIEYKVNGETKYVTSMSYIDSVAYSLKESRMNKLTGVDEWQAQMYQNLDDISLNNSDDLIMVVSRSVADGLAQSYKRSEGLARKAMRASTSTFKLMALSLNPRFVTQQFFGTLVLMMIMNPMQAGHIMARFLQYSLNKRQRAYSKGRWRETDMTVNPYENHGDDYDIIMNRFIREFEDHIYGEDAMNALQGRLYGPKWAPIRKAATAGYVYGMAIEKNFRVAIIRESAMNYPNFKQFMNNNPDVAKRALDGIPEMGYTRVTKFHAAMDLMSDRNSVHYDRMFLRELRHTADMVSGNYRDFRETERIMRDFFIPFYAWTRHSAMYSKRLIQERPLTANSLFNLGNYGYEQIALSGGLPDWLLETIPMPEVVEEALGLDPEKDNRLGMGLINPFGTTSSTIETIAGFMRGGEFRSGSGIFEMTNPLIETFVEQSVGMNLMTGAPVDPDQSFIDAFWQNSNTLPPMRILFGLKDSSERLNELRGMSDPSDILKDPYDPDSKLNIPKPKLSTRFPTLTSAGIVSSTLVPVYSLEPDQLGTAVAREYKERGVLYEEFKLNEQRKQLKTVNALQNWVYKRDFVFNVWMPAFGNSDPALTARVLQQLEREKPSIPKGFDPRTVQAIYSGSLGG